MEEDEIKKCIVKIKTNNAHGTGFFIDSNKILTCFHVIKDVDIDEVKVVFNGQEYSVEIVDKKEEFEIDLAILKVEVVNEKFVPINSNILDEHTLKSYGFAKSEYHFDNAPKGFDRGLVPITLDYEGDEKSFMKFKNGQVEAGHSGSPIINLSTKSVCGILNISRNPDNSLGGYGIPIEKLKLLNFIQNEKFTNVKPFNPLINEWTRIKHEDRRNLKDKLKDSCPRLQGYRIKQYIREVSLGKSEQLIYNEREISTIKCAIFYECQDELMCFIEQNNENNNLTFDDINSLLEKYINRAKKIIDDKRDEYKYGSFSDDIIKKIILDLIDTCYLSFDQEGIYE